MSAGDSQLALSGATKDRDLHHAFHSDPLAGLCIEVDTCPGVCQCVAHTHILCTMWLSHIIQPPIMGTSWSNAMGCFKQPGLLVSQSLSAVLLGVAALWITAGCFALVGQLADPCTNRPFPSPIAVMMFTELRTHPFSCIFHGPALQRQYSLLIKQHQNRWSLLLPTTADNYPSSPGTSSDNWSLATDLIDMWSITSAHAGSLIKC